MTFRTAFFVLKVNENRGKKYETLAGKRSTFWSSKLLKQSLSFGEERRGMAMETIRDIKARLDALPEANDWLETMRSDPRGGVQRLIRSYDAKQQKKKQQISDYKARHDFDLAYGVQLVAGVDEAGRGPLAGPVVTAAVILPRDTVALLEVNDSKQLSKEKRTQLAELIKKHALSYQVHIQSVQTIDELNIYEATKQSMKVAVEKLAIQPDVVLADAMQLPISIPCYSIIKGDAKSLSIAAASILAKTTRDAYMEKLGEEFPGYGFRQHAGYGTAQHLKAISTLGICREHRKTFEPIKSIILEK